MTHHVDAIIVPKTPASAPESIWCEPCGQFHFPVADCPLKRQQHQAELQRVRAELAQETARLELSVQLANRRTAERDDLVQRVLKLERSLAELAPKLAQLEQDLERLEPLLVAAAAWYTVVRGTPEADLVEEALSGAVAVLFGDRQPGEPDPADVPRCRTHPEAALVLGTDGFYECPTCGSQLDPGAQDDDEILLPGPALLGLLEGPTEPDDATRDAWHRYFGGEDR